MPLLIPIGLALAGGTGFVIGSKTSELLKWLAILAVAFLIWRSGVLR